MSLGPIEGLGANTSLSELEDTYNKWSATYEEDMLGMGYPGPASCANIVRNLNYAPESTRILDMAAGTGLVGVELSKLGYKNVDASDMSPEIIKKALEKGVYNRMFRCTMGEERFDSDDAMYDVVTIIGCFSIPVKHQAFQEMHRVLKPGGHIVANFRPNTWTAEDVYGYRAALHAPNWSKVSEELLDMHGAPTKDKNEEFHAKWHFVVFQKI